MARLAPMTAAITDTEGGRRSGESGASVMPGRCPQKRSGWKSGCWRRGCANRISPAEFGLDAGQPVMASDGSAGMGASIVAADTDLRRKLAASCLLPGPDSNGNAFADSPRGTRESSPLWGISMAKDVTIPESPEPILTAPSMYRCPTVGNPFMKRYAADRTGAGEPAYRSRYRQADTEAH